MRVNHQRIELEKALEQWKAAENFLDNVQDPDLVECAVFYLEAAKRSYDYMLRLMKEEELSQDKEA